MDQHLHHLATQTTSGSFASISSNITPRPSTSAGQVAYPTTPDLIALMDEDLAKQTTAELCAYTDFYPYNNILTQALLSCTVDTNHLSDATSPALLADNSYLAAIHQTSIDKLKALTNLHQQTTSFLSGVTLPKPTTVSCSSGVDDESHESFIHSVQPIASVGHGTTMMAQQQQVAHNNYHPQMHLHVAQQQQHLHHHHHYQLPSEQQRTQLSATQHQQHQRLETDECMEVEDAAAAGTAATSDEEIQYEEVTWDEFDPYLFIKHLPPLTPEMRAKCPALPLKTRSSPEFSLVLDLDETLVHCSLQELSDASFKFPVLFQVWCGIGLGAQYLFMYSSLFFRNVITRSTFAHGHSFVSFWSRCRPSSRWFCSPPQSECTPTSCWICSIRSATGSSEYCVNSFFLSL